MPAEDETRTRSGLPDGSPADPPVAPPGEWAETPSLRALRELLARHQQLSTVVARRAELSHRELTALEHLSRGPIGPAELARRLDVSTAASTGLVDRLVARGHAERRPHPEDRRRTEVHPTASGRREASSHLRPMFEVLARLDAATTEEEREVVARYLTGVLAAFDAVIEGPDVPEPPVSGSPAGPPAPPR